MVNQIMRTDALKRNILMSVALLFLLPLLFLTGCESLRASKPIMPIEEYEKMLVGRLDADYVGTNTCLSACHYHDKTRSDFEASTMGAQLSSGSGMPLVNCESCHGPGSLAIKGLTPEKVEADRQAGIQTECDHDTFIDIKGLPPPAPGAVPHVPEVPHGKCHLQPPCVERGCPRGGRRGVHRLPRRPRRA
jgi:hypothetical protein